MTAQQTETSPGRTRAMQRGVDFIVATQRLDASAAEAILHVLARKLKRPVDAVAQDVAGGEPFAGRPAWL